MQYLTVKDVQEILKIGRNNALALFQRDDFPKVIVGKQYRVEKEDFEKYMKSNIGNTIKTL